MQGLCSLLYLLLLQLSTDDALAPPPAVLLHSRGLELLKEWQKQTHAEHDGGVTYTVQPGDSENVGTLIAEKWTGTKSRCSKLCKAGLVLVNKRKVFATARVQANDVLEITSFQHVKEGEEKEKESEREREREREKESNRAIEYYNHVMKTLPPEVGSAEALTLYEDDYLAVINKPAGQHSLAWLGTMKRNSLSIDSILPLLLRPPSMSNEKISAMERIDRPLPCHRLDARVSGCLVVAKTASSLAFINTCFAERVVSKRYIAICCGSLSEALAAHANNQRHRLRVESVPASQSTHTEWTRVSLDPTSYSTAEPSSFLLTSMFNEDTEAVSLTVLSVLGQTRCPQYGFLSLVSLEPITGRRHQLREHCALLGCPIVGDDLFHHHFGNTGTAPQDDDGVADDDDDDDDDDDGDDDDDDAEENKPGVRLSAGLFLSCIGVALPHPNDKNEEVRVELPVPLKFGRLLERASRGSEYDQQQVGKKERRVMKK